MSTAMRIRALVYDAAIVPLTGGWYTAVLERLPGHAHLLDVGIGTGGALLANESLIKSKDLRVTGVDIDAAYIEHCRTAVARSGLADRVEARLESVYDHHGGPYDAVYFAASFMLLPEPPGVLRHVCAQLKPGGRIYFTQTFEHVPSRLAELVKPLLRFVTTIDFGRVTYEPQFREALAAGSLVIEEWLNLDDGRRRSSVLVVARRA